MDRKRYNLQPQADASGEKQALLNAMVQVVSRFMAVENSVRAKRGWVKRREALRSAVNLPYSAPGDGRED